MRTRNYKWLFGRNRCLIRTLLLAVLCLLPGNLHAQCLVCGASGGGSGTVTSFSAGNMAPLFTSAVATATTTPALTFTLSTQTANTVLAGPTSGAAAAPTFRALVGADLPNPSATTLGGIESLAATAHQWINTISTSGVPSGIQPTFPDISGSVACSQRPALTGDVTTPAGSCATTVTTAHALLCGQGPLTVVTGSATDVTLYTCTLPVIPANAVIEAKAVWTVSTSTASSKTYKWWFGATSAAYAASGLNITAMGVATMTVNNNAAQNAQNLEGDPYVVNVAVQEPGVFASPAENTAVSGVILKFTVNNADGASESFTPKQFLVKLLTP